MGQIVESFVVFFLYVESFKCPLEEFISRNINLDVEFMSTYINLDSIQSPLEWCFVVIKCMLEKSMYRTLFPQELLESFGGISFPSLLGKKGITFLFIYFLKKLQHRTAVKAQGQISFFNFYLSLFIYLFIPHPRYFFH